MSENDQAQEPEKQVSIFDEDELLDRGYDKRIRQARNTLFVVAAIQVVFGLVSMFLVETEAAKWFTLGFSIFIALIFFGLGLWTKKRPYVAILVALIFYCLLLLVDAFYDPAAIVKGLILKIVVIIYLVKGLNNAKLAQETRNALGK